jgi:hypothetical protein
VQIEEASAGMSTREAQRSNLTNTGVVSALLLTVVLAMIQADGPVDDTSRFISQWYMVFSLIGMLWCFVATTMSVLLLMYIEPLDDDARQESILSIPPYKYTIPLPSFLFLLSLIFVSQYLDYFGDPVGCIMMAVVCFMNAAVLWVFGRYEHYCGYIAIVVCVFCVQRVLLTYLYVSTFKNPLIDDAERQARKARAAMSTIIGANNILAGAKKGSISSGGGGVVPYNPSKNSVVASDGS